MHWVRWLPLVEWSYNKSYHSAIKMTPYEVVYDQAPPIVTSYIIGTNKVQVVGLVLVTQDDILHLLGDNLQSNQHRMKQQVY